MIIALYGVLEVAANSFLEPMIYGKTTGVSALALLVAAMFWTWLWGGIGLLLSTPPDGLPGGPGQVRAEPWLLRHLLAGGGRPRTWGSVLPASAGDGPGRGLGRDRLGPSRSILGPKSSTRCWFPRCRWPSATSPGAISTSASRRSSSGWPSDVLEDLEGEPRSRPRHARPGQRSGGDRGRSRPGTGRSNPFLSPLPKVLAPAGQ